MNEEELKIARSTPGSQLKTCILTESFFNQIVVF